MRLQADPYLPSKPSGFGVGAGVALLAHTLLLGALTIATNWSKEVPVTATAELWSSTALTTVPAQIIKPPEPEPDEKIEPVRTNPKENLERIIKDVDIAIEKERIQKKLNDQLALEEQKRLRLQQKEKLAKEKAEKAAEKETERRRAENLARITGMAQSQKINDNTRIGNHNAGPSANYAGRIKARIRPNIVYPSDLSYDNRVAEVEVRLAPDGTIIGRKIVKHSGAQDWDEAVLRAIDRTAILPRDTDGNVPSVILISFNRLD